MRPFVSFEFTTQGFHDMKIADKYMTTTRASFYVWISLVLANQRPDCEKKKSFVLLYVLFPVVRFRVRIIDISVL